jgi:hypothetical protein
MFIRCTNPSTQRLKLPWMDDEIEFAATGTAQVEEAVGERLVDELDAIEPKNSHTDTDDDTDTATE